MSTNDIVNFIYNYCYRGTTFREELLRIGELRSLLPDKARVMALTATATRSLMLELIDIIGMINPMTIVLPPCKNNISYKVLPFESLTSNFMPLVEQLKAERNSFPRTIVYCRKMEDCANLYLFFQSCLGKFITEPPGAPNLSQFRLVEMFTSVTDTEVKNDIISLFLKESNLRIVFRSNQRYM
jgi:ATP-dependent DNA helicase RecQ